nr:MAG TPA: hypothetical protein [Caudoviricetes sp.]
MPARAFNRRGAGRESDSLTAYGRAQRWAALTMVPTVGAYLRM